MPPAAYTELLLEEIRQKESSLPKGALATLYFGGGTPSLVPAENIVAIIQELAKHGLPISNKTEVTIEINPATIDPKKMEIYLKNGINRFSVGAQTFDNAKLKLVGREHNATQTRETLGLLKSFGVNYSFDILFALPHQTLDELSRDLDEVLQFEPSHVSPYCLTVPKEHLLSKNRPPEEEQVTMFDLISQRLKEMGYHRYEISNYAKPGFESRHNSLYWDDVEYGGLGLSSHAYSKAQEWGLRYWNTSSLPSYEKQIREHQGKKWKNVFEYLPKDQYEILEKHQSLTDFCHISLRKSEGLSISRLNKKFGTSITEKLLPLLKGQEKLGFLSEQKQGFWSLTEAGLLVSNEVFAQLTFLKGEV